MIWSGASGNRVCPLPEEPHHLAIVHRLWDNADRITPEVIRLWCDSAN
ncbi:MAG: hypothetical protein HY785_17365 [Oscillatoriophycideae cyanobacterium NC_groundwater_1537_Pr4_S-0.65um_50_18]|nr:hypothetical protein [Oscillatoriophycideae cyanobacterium NC_groundwater_1537_Pr4_S-0.65um_50_18]